MKISFSGTLLKAFVPSIKERAFAFSLVFVLFLFASKANAQCPNLSVTVTSDTVCSGTSTSVTFSSDQPGTTYSWTSLQTDVVGATDGSGSTITDTLTTIDVFPGSVVYSVTATANGCTSAPINLIIIVNPVPIVTATPTSQTICSGATTNIALTSTVAGTTFAWTVSNSGTVGATDGAGALIAQTLTTITGGIATYNITPLADGCYGYSIFTPVLVRRIPTVAVAPVSQTICSGDAITNIVITNPNNVSGTVFTWTRDNTVNLTGIAANGSGTPITGSLTNNTGVSQTTIFSITATANTCASAVTTASVTVDLNPTVITHDQTVCAPQTVDLTAPAVTAGSAAGLTFSYYTDAAATSVYLTPTTATAGTYYIVGTTAGGCADTASVDVIVNAGATVVTIPQSVCAPATVDLTDASVTAGSTVGLVFTYYTDAAATTVYLTPTTATAGIYYIVGTLGNGCADTTAVVVTIDTSPTLITHNQSACAPATTVDLTLPAVTLGSTPGQTFTYYTDAAATSLYATPTAATAGTYYIVGTLGSSCADTMPVIVTINAKPNLVITDPTAICAPATADLTLAAVTVGSTPGQTFTYYTDAAAATLYATPTTAPAGTYYIVGSLATGCSDTAAVTVSIAPNPTVNTTDQTVCAPSTVDLTNASVTAGSTAGLTFTYYTNAAATIVYPTPTTATAGTYYIVGTLGSGCADTTSVVVTIDAQPSLIITDPSAVCSPATVDLTAPAVTAGSTPGIVLSYYTDASATIPYATPTAATTGTYYIVASLGTGCSDTAAVNVVINNKPTLITVPQIVCSPASSADLTLAAVTAGSTPGLTFTYFTDASATTPFANATMATAGTYYIVGTLVAGCTDTAAVTVTVNPSPTIITNDQTVCSPSTVDLTDPSITLGSTGGLTFTYFTDAAATAVYGTPTTATAGTYYIVGITASGCADTIPVTVTVTTTPIVVTTPQFACAPATVNITLPAVTAGSTPGLTFTYYTDAAATTPFLTPVVATTGTYYIVGTVGACADTTPVTVTINPKPDVVTNNPSAVCFPSTVDLTQGAVTAGSTIGLTFTYFTDALATSPYATPTIATSGTYYIVGNTLAGCSDTTSVAVTISPKPTVVTTDQVACTPSTVDLTSFAVTVGSTAGLSYTYFTDATATSIYGTPTTATTGTYYIVGTTASGCSDTAAVNVTINPSPTVLVTDPAAVCSPNTVDITAPAIVAGSTVGLTYTYYANAGLTIVVGNPSAIASSGTYYIVGSIGGCSDATPVTVTINPKPSVVTSPLAICLAATVDLTDPTVTIGSTFGLNYTYYTDAGSTILVPDETAVGAGTYYIVGTNAFGCTDTAAVVVDTNPVLILDDLDSCYPDSTADLSTSVAFGTTPGLTYTYFTDALATITYPTPLEAEAGTYYIVGTSLGGCADTASMVYIVNPKPNIIVTDPDTVCAPSTVNITLPAITAGSTGLLSYSYYTNALATVAYGTPGAATTGTYYIVGSSGAGCSDTASVDVVVNPAPNLVITNPSACAPVLTTNLTLPAVTAGSEPGLTLAYFTDLAATAPIADPTAVTAGTYYIQATLPSTGCSIVSPVTFTVNLKPIVLTTNQAICAPGTIDLTLAGVTLGSTAGLAYSYYTDALATLVYGTPTTASNGTYYIIGTSGASCSDTTAVIATVEAQPLIITTPQTVCSPATTTDLTLAAVTAGSTPGLTYTYFTDPGATSPYGTPTAATAGTYYIVGSSAGSCNDTASVTFTVNPTPDLITNAQSICTPSVTTDLTLPAVTAGSTAGLTLSYYTDANATTPYLTPTVATAGTYYIVGVTAAGCADTTAITLTVNPKPIVITTNPPTVCAPTTADLTLPAVTLGSTGSLTYTYFTDAAASTVYLTPTTATSGTYYIVGATIAGCYDTASVVVSADAIPTVLTTPQAVCQGSTVDLTLPAVTAGSTAGLTYSYYSDASATTVYTTPTVAESGTYYIVGVTAGGCSDTSAVVVSVAPTPDIGTNDPPVMCGPSTIDLTDASITAGTIPGGLTFTYYTDAAATLVYPTPTVADSGTYYIVASIGACADTASVDVIIYTPPTVVTNPVGLCLAATVDITLPFVTAGSTPSLTYTYYTDAAATTVYPTPTAATSGTYYIVGLGGNGCSDTASVVVNVGVPPTVITVDQTICGPATDIDLTDASVTLGSTAGLTYTYYTDAAATIVYPTPTNAIQGFYYIVGTTADGCSDTAMVTVFISPEPTVVTTDQSICSPATDIDLTQLAVTAGSSFGLTYTYYTDAAATVVYATPTTAIAGTYYIVGSSGACSDTASVNVFINGSPTVVTTPQAVCQGSTVDLTLPSVTAGSTVGLTYSYYSDASATTVYATPTVAESGTYYIVGVTGGGCSDTSTVVVSVASTPDIGINDPPVMCGPSTINLTDSAITLGTTPSGLTFTYYTDAAATLVYPTPTVADSGTYYIVASIGACADTASVDVIIFTAPTVVTSSLSLCLSASADLTLPAVTSGSTGVITYSYYTDAAATIPYLTPTVATSGTYYIVGLGGNGCSDTASVDVTIGATVITTPQTACGLATVDLTLPAVTAGSTVGLSYAYYTNAAATLAYATPTTATVGTYYIVGTTADGCSDTASVTVTSSTVPSVTNSATGTVCSGQSTNIALTADVASTFTWTVGVVTGGITGASASSGATINQVLINPSNVTAGTVEYIITPTSTAGACVGSAYTITVTVNPSPAMTSTTAKTICSGEDVNLALTASIASNFSWTLGTNIGGITGASANSGNPINQALINPSSTVPGSIEYLVTPTSTAGSCAGVATTVVITVNPKPLVNTIDQVVCVPSTIDLTGALVTFGSTAGLTYTYYTDAAATLMYATPTNASSGTYYIVGLNASGCSDTTAVQATINPVPTVITTPQVACAPGTVDLTDSSVTAGSTSNLLYVYFTNASATIPYFTPSTATAGTYYIVGFVGGGCSDTASVTVTINPKPTVLTNNPGAVCDPSTIDITLPPVTAGSTAGLAFTYFTDSLATIIHPTPTVSVSGVYYIVGLSADGCSDTTSVTVTVDSTPTVVAAPQSACAPSTVDLTLPNVISGSTNNLTLSYYSDALATIPYLTPSTATAGTYYIVGASLAGCSDTAAVTVTINPAPTVVVTDPDTVCAPGTVDITLPAVTLGSTLGLSYTYYTDAAATLLLASPTAVSGSNTYYIVGTTQFGCSDTAAVNVVIDPQPTVVTVTQNVCMPNTTADLTLAGVTTGSTAGLTYTYYTDATATSVYLTPTAAVAGTYYLVGTSTSGCSDTASVIVTVNPKPTVVTVNPSAVCAPSTVDLTLSAVTLGSTVGLTYSYFTDSLATIPYLNFTAADSGVYYIVGVSAAGCSDTTAVTVTVNPIPVLAMSGNNLSCFGVCNGEAVATVAGNSPTYIYSWSTGVVDTTTNLLDTIVSLCAGSYTVTVTDTNGCVATDSIIITEPAQINANVVTTSTTCTDLCNGSAVASPSAGTPPYTYAWSTGATDTIVSGLCAGTYTVIVTDSLGCSSSNPFIVLPAPPVVANETITNASCGDCNGQISVAPSGGTTPFTYLWGNGDTTNTISNLCAGLYSVAITDSVGCVSNISIPISNPGGITAVDIVSTNTTCFGLCDGAVTSVSPVGGSAPYSYLWILQGDTSTTLSNLCSGVYFLQVSDSTGCSIIDSVVITQPSQMLVNPFVTAATCNACDGGATIVPIGGVGPYTILWNTGSTSDTLTNLCAGLYSVQVTDSIGCSQNVIVPVSSDSGPALTISSTSVSCNDSCNATATVVASGGISPYTYLWNDPGAQTDSTANGLCAGTYFVQVTGGGCSSFAQITIANPSPIGLGFANSINPSCNGDDDGVIIVIPSGGTLPYTYSWSSSTGAGNIADSLSAGSYTVTVTDANGCVGTQTNILSNPAALTISNVATNASCNTIADGAIDITVGGGAPTYSYQWSGGSTSTTEDLTNILVGTYTVIATDLNGCTIADTLTLSAGVTVLANAGNDTAFCQPGTVLLSAAGSSSNVVNYQWYLINNPTDSLIGSTVDVSFVAASGTTSYYVVVDNGAGCISTDTVVVGANPSPGVDAGADATIISGTSALLGGNPTGPANATYVWNPSLDLNDASSSNPTATPLLTTTYTVTVTSAEGCISSDEITITIASEINFANGFSPNGDGLNEEWIIDNIGLFPSSVVEIYNRWGELLFQSVGYTETWKGTYKGELLPVGTYYYIINLNSPLFPNAYTGPITILR